MATFKAKVLMQRCDFPLLFSMARRFSVRLPTKLKRLQVSDSLFAFSSLTMTNKPNIQSTGMEKTLNKHTDMEETLNKHTDMEETQKTHRHWKNQRHWRDQKETEGHGKKYRYMEKTSRLPTLYQLVSLSRQSLEIASWPTSKDVLSRWGWE